VKLSDALEGFLLFKAATASTNTVKEYRYSLNMWVEFLGDDPNVMAIESHQIQRFLYHLKVDRGLALKR